VTTLFGEEKEEELEIEDLKEPLRQRYQGASGPITLQRLNEVRPLLL
jgi:hypothetical protein